MADDVGLMQPGPTLSALRAKQELERQQGLRGLLGAIAPALGLAPNPLLSVPAAVAEEYSKTGDVGEALTNSYNAMLPGLMRKGPQAMSSIESIRKVAPKALEKIRERVKGGETPEQVLPDYNALPVMGDAAGRRRVIDAVVPLLPPEARMSDEAADALLNKTGRYEGTFGGFWHPDDLGLMRQHAPDALQAPLIAQRGAAFGEFNPSSNSIFASGLPNIGSKNKDSIEGVVAHEGAHLMQKLRMMPSRGSNPDETQLALSAIRDHLPEKIAQLKSVGEDRRASVLKNAYNEVRFGLFNQTPGVSPAQIKDQLSKYGYTDLDQLTKFDFEALANAAWRKRLVEGLTNPAYRLYRGNHGEQLAEGAARSVVGLPPSFTTPLSKQVLHESELISSDYYNRLAKLYELEKAGLFNSKLRPLSLPPDP